MKNLLIISLCLTFSFTIKAQVTDISNYPFRRTIFEVSAIGFPQDAYEDVPGTGRKYNYYENSLHLAILTNVSKYWLVGINYNYLWTRYKKQTLDNYFFAGINGRYERSIDNRIRFYGDILAEMGNYCSCVKDVRFDNMPYKIENSFYYGVGLGVNYRINKSIGLTVGHNRYYLIGKKYDSYGYGQLILGIQIHAF